MGVACGDFDGDGRLDLAVTNFYGESTTFYRNLGSGQFVDQTAAIGLAAPSRYLLGFGAAFLDANNDGRLDLATANGHVNDLRPLLPYRHARAAPAGRGLGPAGRRLGAGRSCRGRSPASAAAWLVGDLDNDGRLDLLIVSAKRVRWRTSTIRARPATSSPCSSRGRRPAATATRSARA